MKQGPAENDTHTRTALDIRYGGVNPPMPMMHIITLCISPYFSKIYEFPLYLPLFMLPFFSPFYASARQDFVADCDKVIMKRFDRSRLEC